MIEVKTALEDFKQARDARFGIADTKAPPAMVPARFFAELQRATPGTIERADIEGGRYVHDPQRYSDKVKNTTVIYFNWAIVCLRILSHGNEHFPKDGRDDTGMGRILCYTFEDWNRAAALVKWYTKDSLEKRGITGERAPAASKDIAKLPRYIKDSDLRDTAEDDDLSGVSGSDDDDEKKQRRLAHKFYGAQRVLEGKVVEKLEPDPPLDAKILQTDEFMYREHQLELVLLSTIENTSHDSEPIQDRNLRPAIAAHELLRFCEEQAKGVSVVWGESDINVSRALATDVLDPSELLITSCMETGDDTPNTRKVGNITPLGCK